MNAVLHYIYDPLCGWCYGAEPLVWAAAGVDGLALRMHAGGLWPQPTRLPENTRSYIIKRRRGRADAASLSSRFEGLLFDPSSCSIAAPSRRSVRAALDATKGLPMLRGIARAYERGQHVVRPRRARAKRSGSTPPRRAACRPSRRRDLAASRELLNNVAHKVSDVLTADRATGCMPHSRFGSTPSGFADAHGSCSRTCARTDALCATAPAFDPRLAFVRKRDPAEALHARSIWRSTRCLPSPLLARRASQHGRRRSAATSSDL